MNKSGSYFHKFYVYGQGLVEYAILMALVALLAIFGLSIFGGSVKGGLIKICAALGNDDCRTADTEVAVAEILTPTPLAPMAATSLPAALPTLSEPDPTRGPVAGVPPSAPTPAVELKILRVKVVTAGGKSAGGIQMVIYNASGQYVAEGVTDEKGNVNLSFSGWI
jgi:Flp pilus assembly pilin Flp